MPGPDRDVAVIGDGPAGLALAAACRRRGVDVVVIGGRAVWTATYGMWRDDVPALPDECFAHITPSVVVHGGRRHDIERPYGIIDNGALRAHLADGVEVVPVRAEGVQHFQWGGRVLTPAGHHDARFVVDAAGRPSPPGVAGQSAYGVVIGDHAGGDVVLMDLRSPSPGRRPPTFGYVVPVGDGWLVEETVLVARPLVAPAALEDRLVERVGRPTVDAARRRELVAIPMDPELPDRRRATIAFGARAGYVHPTTGYSVAASLRAAPRVATALAGATGCDPRPVWDAVWPTAARRTRRLHRHGQRVLLALDAGELRTFFDAFFRLPVPVWSTYLRIDAPPGEVVRAMWAVARRLPWPLRRKLLGWPGGR